MALPPERIVSDTGKQLAQKARLSKDFIVKSLQRAVSALSELEQLSTLKSALRPLSKSLGDHRLLGHKDKDVRLLVAICFCEIMRVLAPDPSFDDETYKEIFSLFISMFMDLADISSPYFIKRVKILETIDALECCQQMLDIGCDELILKMFHTFFSVVREKHPQSLVNGMLSIMALILKEAEISQQLLEVILQNLRNQGEGAPSASYQLAVKLIEHCSERMKPAVCKFLTCCILDRDDMQSELRGCYHEIIFEIFKCAPQMLTAIIPSIIQESLTDQVDARIKSINLIGKLLSLPKSHYAQEHPQLLHVLLNRLSDKVAEVRISALRSVKACYMSNPLGPESCEILSALESRLLDFDGNVRTEALVAVCDLALFWLKVFPVELLVLITERLRDKMASVRKEALRKLVEVYHHYCTLCCEGQMALSEFFEQIPCKIMLLHYDKNLKEFRPQNLELLLVDDLFPVSLSVEERTRHWIFLYSLFSHAHLKAFSSMLLQKRRLQTEMRVYLTYWKNEKENVSEEMAGRIKAAITRISAVFPDPLKAEECFCSLHQIKDNQIYLGLTQLLDEVSFANARTMRGKFLKKIGDKHPSVEFLKLLSLKCFHGIFNFEHVRCILDYISGKSDNLLKESSVTLLQVILNNFPMLLRGCEYLFQLLILEGDSSYREKLIQVLAKAGPYVSIRLSDVYPSLEKFCLEGNRSLSKAAVSAIAAIAGPSEQFIFADLCQKLLESLHDGRNISTVLQSFGCLARHSVVAFRNQENEISSFIKERIFEKKFSGYSASLDENSGCSFSFNCKTKLYGLKTLVKFFLAKNGADGRHHIDGLLDILFRLLQKSEFVDLAVISESDMDHIRLAAAKSVLQLSARWDTHISLQIFQSTVMMAKDNSFTFRRLFLDKTYKLLKEHAIPNRYACAFPLAASDCMKEVQDVSFCYLVEFIREHSTAAQMKQISAAKGGNMTHYPAYIVVYLIYILAHDGDFPPGNSQDENVYAKFCWPLFLILHTLGNAQFVNGDMDLVKNSLLYLLHLFRAVKRAEDAIDAQGTSKLHKLAEIGSFFVRAIKPESVNLSLAPKSVLLPSSLYRTSQTMSTEETSSSPVGYSFGKRFLEKIMREIENKFDQPSSSTAAVLNCDMDVQKEVLLANTKHHRNANKERISMSSEGSRVRKDQEKIDETDSSDVGMRERPEVVVSSFSLRPVNSEELEINGSGNPKPALKKEKFLVFSSGTSTLSETEPHVSTAELDALFSASLLDDHKRKGSTNSGRPQKCSKTKASAVPFTEAQCCNDPLDQSSLDDTSQSFNLCGERKNGNQGLSGSKGKGLDRTNSLMVDLSKGLCQKKRSSGTRFEVDVNPSVAMHDSGANMDSIAFRTRRRKA